ncbi:MAG: hypothetical protein WA364_20035 [Candidatus Nitrosopolaris sp.]
MSGTDEIYECVAWEIIQLTNLEPFFNHVANFILKEFSSSEEILPVLQQVLDTTPVTPYNSTTLFRLLFTFGMI